MEDHIRIGPSHDVSVHSVESLTTTLRHEIDVCKAERIVLDLTEVDRLPSVEEVKRIAAEAGDHDQVSLLLAPGTEEDVIEGYIDAGVNAGVAPH